MKGWVTITTALVSAVYGVAGFAMGAHDATTMMGFILGGSGAVGLGRKVDKNTEATHGVALQTAVVATELSARETERRAEETSAAILEAQKSTSVTRNAKR